MGFKNLTLIKPQTKSKVIQGTQFILEQIEANYDKIPNKAELKYLPSFILYVCCLVEEAYSNKRNLENGKLNKKDEVFKIIVEFIKISLTEQDKKVITEIIEDLHTSGRIKKVSYLTKTFFHLSNVFLNKVHQ